MNRRSLLAGIVALPFAGMAVAKAGAFQAMLDAEAFASFPGETYGNPTIYDIANEIMDELQPLLPPGTWFGNKCNPHRGEYHVDPDPITNILIISNPSANLGFAVTQLDIGDGSHIEAVKNGFRSLVKCVEQARYVQSLPEHIEWRAKNGLQGGI